MLGADPHASRSRNAPAAGDQRLLVTRTQGQTRAVLYRAIVPGTPQEARTVFESPIGKVAFDEVKEVSSTIKLQQAEGNYLVIVPLDLLGLFPGSGTKILGDVGILQAPKGGLCGEFIGVMQTRFW